MGGCFSHFSPSTGQDDPSEDQYKTAIKISRHEKEDGIVRQKREKEEQVAIERAKEISLKQFEKEEAERRLQESKEEDKREKVDADDDQVDDEQTQIDKVKEESLKQFEKEEAERRRLEKSKEEGKRKQVEEEEDKEQIKHSKDKEVNPPAPPSICNGCKSEFKDGPPVNAFGGLWHPECLCCLHCRKPIAVDEVSRSQITRKGKFHKPCYREHRSICCVCQKKLPSAEKGLVYNEHPFWKEKYCPCHDSDGTAKCCSCERLEPRGTNFVMLGDDRWLCLQCMQSSIMDTYECHDLHLEIRDFFDGLFLKVEKQFPVLLVEKQALNEAEKEEKIDNHHAGVTRGLCLSEVQNVRSVKVRPKWGPTNKLIDIVTETQIVDGCPVTAVLIIYGLPRSLTGYILAHEMMHAYLRVKGHNNLNNVLEEGICQVIGHMWLETQRYAPMDLAASSSAASSSNASKKGEWSESVKELVEFCKHQIETDESEIYGEGFRKVNHMVKNSNLQETLKEILSRRG